MIIINITIVTYSQDNQHSPSQSLGALLVSPTTQFINAVSSCLQNIDILYFVKVDNSVCVLKPTPVRPKPCLYGKQLQRQLSVSSDNRQDTVRPPKVS